MQTSNEALWQDLSTHAAGKYFSTSIKEVIGTMAAFNISESPEPVLEQNTFLYPVSGVMMLSGKHNMLCYINLTKEDASVLISYMTGIQPSDLSDDEIYDGVSELINMICGSAKSFLANTEYAFTLNSPFTVVAEKQFIIHKKNITKLYKKFKAANMELILKLIIF